MFKKYLDNLSAMIERNGKVVNTDIYTEDNGTKYCKELTFENGAVWCEVTECVKEFEWKTVYYASDIGVDSTFTFYC